MADTPLTEAQRALMPSLGDDACGLWDLVWLETDEQHPGEASVALLGLFRSGYAEVYEFEPGGEPRLMQDRQAAEHAISDLSNWKSPPDEAKERCYAAYLTESGFGKWRDDAASRDIANPS